MLASLTLLTVLTGADLAARPVPEHAAVSGEVSAQLERALVVADARVVAVGFEPRLPRGCYPRHATLPSPLAGSGRVAVKLRDAQCPGWAWLRVEVWAKAAITTRPVRAGQSLAGTLVFEEREVRVGHEPWLPPAGAVAQANLPRGTLIEKLHVAGATVASGSALKVVVVTGALAAELQGRAVACGAGRVCAVLPSGRHVEGHMEDGYLLVEVP
jgi:hypothetical protein